MFMIYRLDVDRSLLVSQPKKISIFSSNPLLNRNDASFEGNEKCEKLLLQQQDDLYQKQPVYKETTEKKIQSTRSGIIHQVRRPPLEFKQNTAESESIREIAGSTRTVPYSMLRNQSATVRIIIQI